VQPPRTHILKDVLAINDFRLQNDPRMVQACATLDHLWPKTRYPKEQQPTVEEAERAVVAAEVIRSAVRAVTAAAGPSLRSG
jgi:HEPN domain-containing protein